jgi:hypothetical protein
MPKNMRFACFLVALCVVSLLMIGWPTARNPQAAGASGGFFGSRANCAVPRSANVGPIDDLSLDRVKPSFAFNHTQGSTNQDGRQQSNVYVGRPEGARTLAAGSPAVAVVNDHRTTTGPIPNNCVAPTAKVNFSPTDAQAYQ